MSSIIIYYVHVHVLIYVAESNFTSLVPLGPSYDSTTMSSIIIAVPISVTSFALLSVIIIILCGVVVIILKSRPSKSETSTDEVLHPSDMQVFPPPIYESVFPMEFQEQELELKENEAYGPVPFQEQALVLKENVAYRPIPNCHNFSTQEKDTATDPVYSNVS